jgi:hypothetical protein
MQHEALVPPYGKTSPRSGSCSPAAKERAATLPHRERDLHLVHRLGDLLLDAHEQWLNEVEQELSQP